MRHPSVLTPNRLLQHLDEHGTMTKLLLSYDLMGPSLREIVFAKQQQQPLQSHSQFGSQFLTPQRVRVFMSDLLGGLAYLHSRGIIRRCVCRGRVSPACCVPNCSPCSLLLLYS